MAASSLERTLDRASKAMQDAERLESMHRVRDALDWTICDLAWLTDHEKKSKIVRCLLAARNLLDS